MISLISRLWITAFLLAQATNALAFDHEHVCKALWNDVAGIPVLQQYGSITYADNVRTDSGPATISPMTACGTFHFSGSKHTERQCSIGNSILSCDIAAGHCHNKKDDWPVCVYSGSGPPTPQPKLPKCVGKSTAGKGCGAVNATSSTCGQYFMKESGSSGMQCKWGDSCYNGGGACNPP